MPDFAARMDTSGTYRPILEVVVRAGRVRRRLKAVVDSGADRSIIPAELLGDLIAFEDLPSVGMAGDLRDKRPPHRTGYLPALRGSRPG